MRVFYLDRKRQPYGYGWLENAVVIALNETAARHLIVDSLSKSEQSDRDHWLSPEHTNARDLGDAGDVPEEIVDKNYEKG